MCWVWGDTEPIDQPTNEPIDQPTNELLFNRPKNQPTHRPTLHFTVDTVLSFNKYISNFSVLKIKVYNKIESMKIQEYRLS